MNTTTMGQPGQTHTSSHGQPRSYGSAVCSAAASQHQANPFHPPNKPSTTLLPSPSAHDTQQQQEQHHNQSENPPLQPTQQPTSEQLYPHQIHALGGPTATAPFLRDFSLVAEAARRAQVSVVARDLEGISL